MATPTDYPADLPQAMVEVATAAADWVVVWPVALALAGAGLLVMLRNRTEVQALMAGLVTLAIIVSNIYLLARVVDEGPIAMTMGKWLPPFGITFAADAIGALFALAASIATLVVIVYAQLELKPREIKFGYYPMILLLLCGVSGSFLTGDLFNLYVWFEVMLIASFGLLVLGGRKVQLDGAIKYGFLNFLATTFFLIAIAFTYGLTGTLNMADLAQKAGDMAQGGMLTVSALFILAFGIKAAAFPANAWLPASYHTPSVSVSALFGGLLTKVGAYAMFRVMLLVLPEGREILDPLISAIAVGTLVIAPLGALAQTNLRRAIGFFVIGGIGAILSGLAIGTPDGIAGGTVYAVHSMLTMTVLYLAAGIIEKRTGTTDTRMMGGLYGASAPLSIVFLILVFAVSGVPPFIGFWPKAMLVQAGIADGDWIMVVAILVNSLITIIAASRLWSHIFWRVGREGERSEQPNPGLVSLDRRDVRLGMVPMVTLVAFLVLVGLFPNRLIDAGQIAGRDLVTPDRYVEAVFSEVPQP